MTVPPPGGTPYPGYGSHGYGQYPPQSGGQPPYHPGYPPTPAGPHLADWGTRALAYLLDTLIMVGLMFGILIGGVALSAGITYLTGGFAALAASDTPPVVFIVGTIVSYVAAIVAPYVYRWLWHAGSGQTVGKRVMRIRLVRLDTMQPPGKGTSAGRELVMVGISFVTCGVGSWLDLLWPLGDQPNQQTLHDKPAGTVVIQSG